MPKRVSLKGKGADIFFGDYAAADRPSAEPSSLQDADNGARLLEGEAPLQASTGASVQASKNARSLERKRSERTGKAEGTVSNEMVPQPEPTPPVVTARSARRGTALNGIWRQVAEPATITNSFRYTEREMWGLTEAIFDIAKQHGVKLSKQDIARLGLDYVLWDYQTRGAESLLGEFVGQRKRQNGADL
jgi:hypothetical protein